MSTEYLINDQQDRSTTKEASTAVHTNTHHDLLYKPLTSPNGANQHAQQVTALASSANPTTEIHTKELLDEALDSVKNVLMQTFKKNLESGGDLNALKSTLGSDEVAEVFLAKLRQSLKRDNENESKSQEIHMDVDSHHSQCSTPSSSSNALVSPVMNVGAASVVPSTTLTIEQSPSPSSPFAQTITTPTQKRKPATPVANPNRFEGTTEEELAKRVLQDILQPNLDIVFVGVNPSLYAVHKGHHYGGPGNHFWKLLHLSGLIPSALNANDDYRLPQYGIGFTNIVQRPSKAGSDITKDEITAGAEVLMQKMKMYRPKIMAFNGRGIYEVYAGNKHFHYGKQPEPFPGTETHVFVMPSSSARCSQLPRAEDKLPFYVGLRKLRDFVNGTLHSLNEAEITFPDIKIKDIDDASQKTVVRISNKPFSELSAEIRKSYGDKIPSAQMITKHLPSPSSPNLILNTDALTTQTMSILHNTNHQQNENIFTSVPQPQRISLPTVQPRLLTNGTILTKSSPIENSPSNSTNAAVLAALASGGYNSSSPSQQTFYQPSQTVYVGGQQQQSYATSSSLSNHTTDMNGTGASHRYHPYRHESRLNERRSATHSNHPCAAASHPNAMSHPQPKPATSTFELAQPQSSIPLARLLSMAPQERQAWMRSLKRTNVNQSTEQRTQYLETVLRRVQQQRSLSDPATFDRVRFATEQTSAGTNAVETDTSLRENSFHLINQTDNETDICTIEKVFFGEELQSTLDSNADQKMSLQCDSTVQTNVEPHAFSGFLIDNCDDEELSPLSPPLRSSLPSLSTPGDSIQTNPVDSNQSRASLVNEFHVPAAIKRREKSECPIQSHDKRQEPGTPSEPAITMVIEEPNSPTNHSDLLETSSDWIIECEGADTAQPVQVSEVSEKTSATGITAENDEIAGVSAIFRRIRKQEKQLKRLRKSLRSLLAGNQAENGPASRERLLAILNQAMPSGCWLCSGKSYAEVAVQCNTND